MFCYCSRMPLTPVLYARAFIPTYAMFVGFAGFRPTASPFYS